MSGDPTHGFSGPSLLAALAAFLEGDDLARAVTDPALGFRLKIAASLAHLAAAEAAHGEALTRARLARLAALAPALGLDVPPAPRDHAGAQVALDAGRAALSAGLRAGEVSLSPELRGALLEDLAAELRLASPRFRLDLVLAEEGA